jgi:TDG/mug DNA glycosylase family protein
LSCGTAAGSASAALGAYYAGPGNKFWPVLAQTGLTPHRLDPASFREVPQYGIGLTDLAKEVSGADRDLPAHGYDVPGFIARIRSVQPRIVAFNGKKAASIFHRSTSARIGYGQAEPVPDFPAIWVLPSTSGAAAGAWDPWPWHALARWVRDHP